MMCYLQNHNGFIPYVIVKEKDPKLKWIKEKDKKYIALYTGIRKDDVPPSPTFWEKIPDESGLFYFQEKLVWIPFKFIVISEPNDSSRR